MDIRLIYIMRNREEEKFFFMVFGVRFIFLLIIKVNIRVFVCILNMIVI